jgi:hypothetical protein
MRSIQTGFAIVATIGICVFTAAAQASLQNGTIVKVSLSESEKKIVADFETAAKNYAAITERVRKQLPKLPDKATPEQIVAHKTALRQGVQMTWANAKPGDIFTPAAAAFIKTRIKTEFKGWERSDLRKTVLEADTKVPLKINTPYPESKELVEMSPALLLALPQLPKQLRYRFVTRSLVIMDRDNGLLVDYLKDALP